MKMIHEAAASFLRRNRSSVLFILSSCMDNNIPPDLTAGESE